MPHCPQPSRSPAPATCRWLTGWAATWGWCCATRWCCGAQGQPCWTASCRWAPGERGWAAEWRVQIVIERGKQDVASISPAAATLPAAARFFTGLRRRATAAAGPATVRVGHSWRHRVRAPAALRGRQAPGVWSTRCTATPTGSEHALQVGVTGWRRGALDWAALVRAADSGAQPRRGAWEVEPWVVRLQRCLLARYLGSLLSPRPWLVRRRCCPPKAAAGHLAPRFALLPCLRSSFSAALAPPAAFSGNPEMVFSTALPTPCSGGVPAEQGRHPAAAGARHQRRRAQPPAAKPVQTAAGRTVRAAAPSARASRAGSAAPVKLSCCKTCGAAAPVARARQPAGRGRQALSRRVSGPCSWRRPCCRPLSVTGLALQAVDSPVPAQAREEVGRAGPLRWVCTCRQQACPAVGGGQPLRRGGLVPRLPTIH